MKYWLRVAALVGLVALELTGCAGSGPFSPSPNSGSLSGRVVFGSVAHSVFVTIEKTDGLKTLAVHQSVQGKAARSVLVTTAPDSSGYYKFEGLGVGLYTVYASSNDSKEKAVRTNVEVAAGLNSTASDLYLTPVGNLSGSVQIGGLKTGNAGFLVFVAGTSYMAVTSDSGDFVISDVPVGADYAILLMRGDHVFNWAVSSVTVGTTLNIGTKVINSAELVNPLASLSWRGSFASAPSNPQVNWAYYDTTAKKSYLWDGSAWQILAQDGAVGATGATGATGPVGATGAGINWQGALAAAPLGPEMDWAYYDTTAKRSYIWNGSSWQILAQDGAPGANGSTGAVGANGIGVTWKGAFPASPAGPQINWAYYDTTAKKSYLWDGGAWQVLAQDGVTGPTGATGPVGATGAGISWQGSLITAPSSPQLDWAYYDTTSKKSYIWNGMNWQILAQDGATGATGSTGAVGANGIGVMWKGSFASAPSSPQINWAYYDTTAKKSYLWDGGAWQILAQDGQPGAPPAPNVLTISYGVSQFSVSWTAISGATSYNLYYSTTSGFEIGTVTKMTGVTSPYQVTGLPTATKYYIVVTAANGGGESAVSNQAEVITAGIITTIAGTGIAGYNGDGGEATSTNLQVPLGVAVDPLGNMYIAEYTNHRIRKVTKAGVITTVAGTGVAGFSGDGGPATAAQLENPSGIALDSSSNLYICDFSNNRIRKVAANGIISTVAGTGTAGFSGDGGAATLAQIALPDSVAVDSAGNLYIGDSSNNRVRKVTPAGVITTVAGTGVAGHSGDGGAATSAMLNHPSGVVIDSSGNLYICDYTNHSIRKVTAGGIITTIAGTGVGGFSGDGGAAIQAKLSFPYSIVVDAGGNLYFTEFSNFHVRKVSASGIISTVAGNGSPFYSGEGGPATSATLPATGIAQDAMGNLYLAGYISARVLKITGNGGGNGP